MRISVLQAGDSGIAPVAVRCNRPGRIKTIVGIDLPRPRRYEMVATPEFQKLHRTVLDDIRAESIAAAALDKRLA